MRLGARRLLAGATAALSPSPHAPRVPGNRALPECRDLKSLLLPSHLNPWPQATDTLHLPETQLWSCFSSFWEPSIFSLASKKDSKARSVISSTHSQPQHLYLFWVPISINLPFTELLCVKLYAKPLTCIISLNPHNNWALFLKKSSFSFKKT